MNIRIFFSILVLFFVSKAFSQQSSATIKGKITDATTKAPLEFANVVLFKKGVQVGGTKTDLNGKYTFTSVTPGNYDIIITYVGYQKTMEQGIRVTNGIEFVNIKLAKGVVLKGVKVVSHKIPLIDKGKTSSGGSVGEEDIQNMAARSASDIVKTIANVTSQDDGSNTINMKGSRSNSTDVYIDGIRVRGTQNLPAAAIQQVTAVTGGLPAMYGDVTGGIINITTKGATKNWFGGAEILTSGAKVGDRVIGLDNYGFNLLALSLSGPLLLQNDSNEFMSSFSKKYKQSKSSSLRSKMGFFFSTELKHQLDPRPYYGGDYKLKDNALTRSQNNPLQTRVGGNNTGLINSASFLRKSDMEKGAYRKNVVRKSINIAGKIDVNTSDLSTLTFGGSLDFLNRQLYNRENSLLNFENNADLQRLTYRIYGRYIQRFENKDDNQLVKDAFFTIQGSYSLDSRKTQDAEHKDNFSRYGYLGKFSSERTPSYSQAPTTRVVRNTNGDTVNTLIGIMQNGTPIVRYSYSPDFSINPILARYTQNYYDIYKNNPGRYATPEDVTGGGALINGTIPIRVYSLYNPQGLPYNNYDLYKESQVRFSASGNASIKDHAIKIGIVYEQRTQRRFFLDPVRLWTVGRQLVNAHTRELSDLEGQYQSTLGSGGIPIYSFQQKNASPGSYKGGDAQTFFDYNIRRKLGLNTDGVDYIDFDSYGPDIWNLGDFSADDILNNYALSLPFFRGYTHDGKETSSSTGIDDFFNATDEFGNKTRLTAPFQPIYIAGYIQDEFSIDDLVFNVGLRFDRYDANQFILKDKYSLFPTRTVGDVGITNRPSNIGDDFVPYVQDPSRPSTSTIVGYRNGDTWYNALGEQIEDPSVLSADKTPKPWLVNTNDNTVKTDLTSASFKKYTPNVIVSPRIAFSFPLSEEALFYAHYDLLVQRPTTGSALSLVNYFLIQDNNRIISNPNLRSEKTIDFQVGFQQKLDDYSALKFSAFFRDMRDMIQLRQVKGAYPENYLSYANIDFGTVKGLTMQYDLRRKGNVTLRASYTLQFASGTGSDATSALNSVSGGSGNIQTVFPLNFDQRHALLATIDYRYSDGEDYNGPEWGDWSRSIFENLGANLVLRMGSGRPYTKQQYATGRAFFNPTRAPLDGAVNNARLPWNYTVDLKVDKTIYIIPTADGAVKRKNPMSFNIYLQVLNLLNTQNTLSAYRATGSPVNDGYLESARYVNSINNREDVQSFKDLYTAKVNDPSNFAIPRRVQLGILFNF